MKHILTIKVGIDFDEMLSHENLQGAMLALGAKDDSDAIRLFSESIVHMVEVVTKRYENTAVLDATIGINEDYSMDQPPTQDQPNHPQTMPSDNELASSELTPEQLRAFQELYGNTTQTPTQDGEMQYPDWEPEDNKNTPEDIAEPVENISDNDLTNEGVYDSINDTDLIDDNNEKLGEYTEIDEGDEREDMLEHVDVMEEVEENYPPFQVDEAEAELSETKQDVAKSLFEISSSMGSIETIVVKDEEMANALINEFSILNSDNVVIRNDLDSRFVIRYLDAYNKLNEMEG